MRELHKTDDNAQPYSVTEYGRVVAKFFTKEAAEKFVKEKTYFSGLRPKGNHIGTDRIIENVPEEYSNDLLESAPEMLDVLHHTHAHLELLLYYSKNPEFVHETRKKLRSIEAILVKFEGSLNQEKEAVK